MIDHGFDMKDIRRDILRWPGARSIRDHYELDVFAPTTLAIVAELLKAAPRAKALIALAQTADWTRAAADELVDLVDDWRVRNNAGIAMLHEEAHAARVIRENVRKSHASRRKKELETGKLPVLQGLVQHGEKIFGPDIGSVVIADWINSLEVHKLNIPCIDRNKLFAYEVEKVASFW